MAASADGFGSNVPPNQRCDSVDSSSSSCRPVYLALEPRLTESQESLFPPISRKDCRSFPLSHEKISSIHPHWRISHQSTFQQRNIPAKEEQSCALKPVWYQPGTTHFPRVAPPGAPLDSRGIQNRKLQHIPRPPAVPIAGGSFFPLNRPVATRAKLPAAECLHTAVIGTVGSVHGKSRTSPAGNPFPPVGIIPNCFYPDNIVSLQPNGTENVLAYSPPRVGEDLPRERLCICGSRGGVEGIVNGPLTGMPPRKPDSSTNVAVWVADAAPITNNLDSGNTVGNSNCTRVENKHGRAVVRSPGNSKEPFSSSASGGPHHTTQTSTRRYTVLMQHSKASGRNPMQTTASFALPGSVVPRKSPPSERTAARSSSATHCPPMYKFYSNSTFLPTGYLLAPLHNPNASTSFAASPQCSPSLSDSRDCRVTPVTPMCLKPHIEVMSPQAGQQHAKFLLSPHRFHQYLPGAFRTGGVPVSMQGSQWCHCPSRDSQASDHAHSSPLTIVKKARATHVSHLQPLVGQSVHLGICQPERDFWEGQASQHDQQAQPLCRRKCQQSTDGLQSPALPERGFTALAASAPRCEVRILQRSRSHPPKASSYTLIEELGSTSNSTQTRVNERENGLKVGGTNHEADEQCQPENAVGLEKHWALGVDQFGEFGRSDFQLLQPVSAASLPVSSDSAQRVHAKHKSSTERPVHPQDKTTGSPARHAAWRQPPVTMRTGRLQTPSAASDFVDGTVSENPSTFAFNLPPSLKTDFSALLTAFGSAGAPNAFRAASVQDQMQESYGEKHLHRQRAPDSDGAELLLLEMQQEKRCSFEETLWSGSSSSVDAAVSSCTASTTCTGYLPCASAKSQKEIFDRPVGKGFHSHSQHDRQRGIDSTTCTGGRQSSLSDSATERAFISIKEREGRNSEGNMENEKQENADIIRETSCSSTPEEHKRFSQPTRETGKFSVTGSRREGAETPRLRVLEAKEGTRSLPTEVRTDGTSSRSERQKIASPEASGEGEQYRTLEVEVEKSDCTDAVRRKQDECREGGSVRMQWENDDWAALHASAIRPYSKRSSQWEHEHKTPVLQHERQEEGQLESPGKLAAATKLTPHMQVTRNSVSLRETANVYRRLLSGSRRPNALKSNAEEGKHSGLPWKSVIVNTKNCRVEKALINTCAERLGWGRQENDAFKGHIVWLGGSAPDFEHLHYNKPIQILNRFPGMWDMTKKRMLYRILSLYGQLFPDEYDFFPQCWSLPEDRVRIEQMLHGENKKYYILKPDGGARGNGVQLVSLYKDIDPMVLRGDGSYIMQKYVENPYLLNKKKFDFRIYCVLFSVSGVPKAYVSKLGMVRFCTEEYQEPSRKNIDNPFMHLTNYSINKDNLYSFVRSTDLHDDTNSKRLLKDVFEELAQDGVNVDAVWQQIKSITAKTVVCLQPWLNLRYRHIYRGRSVEPSRCFQLLGLDILLDKNNKCWLLEVNSNPSLRIDYFDSKYDGIDVQLESAVDRHIKEPVVTEALALAYHVLLQHRQPYVQPLPRCCSRNKEIWQARKAAAASVTGTAKQQGRSRGCQSKKSSPIGNCCSGSEEEEETETEYIAAAGKETGAVGGRGGKAATTAGSKVRASSVAPPKAAAHAAAVRKAAGRSRASRRADSARTLEVTAGATGGSAADLKKAGAAAHATIMGKDAKHKAESISSSSGKLSGKQTAAVKRLGDRECKEKEDSQRDYRTPGTMASSRSRQGPQLQQQFHATLLGKRFADGRKPLLTKKTQTHTNADELADVVHAGRRITSARSSGTNSRGVSAASVDRNRKGVVGVGGICQFPAVAREARTKIRTRKSTLIYDTTNKYGEEENEEDNNIKTTTSPKSAVEEAKRLLEHLGPAAMLDRPAGADGRLPSSPENSGVCDLECPQQSKTPFSSGARAQSCSCVAAAIFQAAGAALAPATSSSAAVSQQDLNKICVQRERALIPQMRRLCSDAVETKGLGDDAEQLRRPSSLPLSAGVEAQRTLPWQKSEENTGEEADPVHAPRSDNERMTPGGGDEVIEVNDRPSGVATREEENSLFSMHSVALPKSMPRLSQTSQSSGRGKGLQIDGYSSPASSPDKPVVQEQAEQACQEERSASQDPEKAYLIGEVATEVDACGRETTKKTALPTHSPLSKQDTMPNAACTTLRDTDTRRCGTRSELEGDIEAEASASTHCSTRTNSINGSRSGHRPHILGVESMLASASSFVSSYPSSPSVHSREHVAEEETRQESAANSSSAAAAVTARDGSHSQRTERGGGQEQYYSGIEKETSDHEDLTSVDGWEADIVTLHAEEPSDKEDKTARGSPAENGEFRLPTEAEQLAVKLEWIEEAYREMERCMDRFNILGLRFASSTASSSSQQQCSGSGGDAKQQGEGAASGAAIGRRGGGGGGAGGSRAVGGREGKRTGPYKPFLRKDKLANRNGNQTPPKSCYTKLHKDILHPLPPEYLKPQHCWSDLAPSIAPLVEKTACVLQVQLLFERIVGFPRLICLQREKLLEVCRLVKLPDVLRKVQVPIIYPPTNRPASSRLKAAARPLPHASSFAGSSALRVGGRETPSYFSPAVTAANGGAPELSRSGNGAWLAAATVEAAVAGGESFLNSGCTGSTRLFGKKTQMRSSSSRAGSNGTGNSVAPQLSRNAGLTQRQGGGRSSVSRLLVSRGFSGGGIERRRRLGLPDLEVLFYAQLQSVRRQLQLQEASFGLGLLETWYLLEPIALVCYPFFPTKAKLLEAFVSPLSASWHDKQRPNMQMRLLKSPMHTQTAAVGRTTPKIEQMLQQLEEEDRLAFAAAGGELAASGRSRRSKSRCRIRTAAAKQEKPSCSDTEKGKCETDQSEETAGESTSLASEDEVILSQNLHYLSNSKTGYRKPSVVGLNSGILLHEQQRRTRLIDWDSAQPAEECTTPLPVLETRAGRSVRVAEHEPAVASTDTPAKAAQEPYAEGGGTAVATGASTTAKVRNMTAAEAAGQVGKINLCGKASTVKKEVDHRCVRSSKNNRGALQERCIVSDGRPQETSAAPCCEPAQQPHIVAHQRERPFMSAASSHLHNDMQKDSDYCVKGISFTAGAGSAPAASHRHTAVRDITPLSFHSQTPERFAGGEGARLPSDAAAVAKEWSTAASPLCGEKGRPVKKESVLQAEAPRQPLLFLWGHEQQKQQKQRSFANERDLSTASTQRSAPVQSAYHQRPQPATCTCETASFPAVAAASSCARSDTPVAPGNNGAASEDHARAMLEEEQREEELGVLLQAAPVHKAGAATSCGGRSDITPRTLRVSQSTRGSSNNNHSGSSGGPANDNVGSRQEGKCEEEVCDAENLSQASRGVPATPGATESAASAAGGFQIPEWHAGLCAAWPEGLCSYIQESVPTKDRLEAMKRLVDYFHLRLDYCSFCALVPGGATAGGRP